MRVVARYFDHHLGASVIEYALKDARARWTRTADDVVRVLWCPRASDDDEFEEFEGCQYAFFRIPDVHHTDDAHSERAACLLLFGSDKEYSDDNAIGIEFKLTQLIPRPGKGQTVREYIVGALRREKDVRVIEKVGVPSLFERLGDVPIIPDVMPVEFV